MLAGPILPPKVQRYQIDHMQLRMCEQWDAAFLLDVIDTYLKTFKPCDRRMIPLNLVVICSLRHQHFRSSGVITTKWHITSAATDLLIW
jgi:hypothetical protein